MASSLNIVVHDEDGALWATVEEMPGVFATGDTMDELRESLQEGISLWLAEPGQDASPVVLGEIEKKQLLASASFAHA
jgi:predicted RNase H-like HicB family nuclease